jgi:hypothetical protein
MPEPRDDRPLIWLALARAAGASGGGGGGATGSYAFAVGVVVGSAVYVSAPGTVDRALATSLATMPAIGVVTKIVGAVATVTTAGEAAIAGLTSGARHYVSAAVAGALTSAAPAVAGQVAQQVGVAKSGGVLVVQPQVPVQV